MPPGEQASGDPPSFGLGHDVSDAEIAAWDRDVTPDGHGLPPGSGTAIEGATVYARECAFCHGATGVEGPYGPLVGGLPDEGFVFATDPSLRRTVGNYWPWATTLFDYINRAMPYPAPGSLGPDEVYAVTAYLLFRNGLIAEDAVISATTLPEVVMPARDRFVSYAHDDGR